MPILRHVARSSASAPPRAAAPTLDIDGRSVAVEVRASQRARRMLLRVDQKRDVVVVTLPPFVPRRDGLRFAREHVAWIAQRLAAAPARQPFAAGAVLPVLGRPARIVHHADSRAATRLAAGTDGIDLLNVGGAAEHVRRRVEDFLKRRARSEIVARAHPLAQRLGRPIKGITLRDPGTRWGSCSPAGKLSFSWRLILAPPAVLDYVVAHEVAHLAVFDHSARFWATVADLIGDAAPARAWLREHGGGLHRFG
ncbi:M48 family metallopeptidase [Zavarzinia sp. CC-PAN008]|uniref:M48 family metallopeptidase n=1 Tax=Zavarzinia sp. CC-PAN008 TaxID=3243332 RepID=UPI003F7461CA